ncbi:Kelch-like protein 10 [Neonectria magnoliae]|uniref:Kelch-like protein 10 n=1 Tax=Neonectria magnoliae TaxID=2732573 RepID=A0ABR1IHD4_9HYPO
MDNQNQPKVAPKARPPSSTGSDHRDGHHDVIENLCLTSVHSSLSKLLLSEKFSDMTILCRGHEFKAHRAIVCTQSSFFDGAFSTSFKEAASKTIELPEDDPEVVKRFLEFLYTGSYTDGVALNAGKPSTAAMLTPEEIQESLNSPPGIIIDRPSTQPKEMARKVFNLTTPPLTTGPQAGRSTTSSEDPPADDGNWSTQTSEKDGEEPEEEYNDFDEVGSYGDQDKDDSQSTAGAEMRGDFFLHLRLYILADKYDVPALRLLARDRFYQEVEFTWEETERFPELVDELYRNTPPTDTAMREIVCRLVGNRILDDDVREKMRPVMVEHGDFAVGVMEYHMMYSKTQW